MLKRLKYYLRVYAEFLKLNVQSWAEYRVDFMIGIFAMFLTNVVTVAFFWVLFQQIPTLNGWTFDQLIFMFGFEVFTFGVWHAFLSGCTVWEMDRQVRQGDLDRNMLRPINTLVLLVIRRLDDDGFGDFIAGVLLLAYSVPRIGVAWTAQNVAAMALFSASSIVILFSINILMAATSFWTTSGRSLSDLFWNTIRFVEYPINIYNAALVWILTYVVPFGFISFYPAQYFFGNGQWLVYAYATPFVAVISFVIAYAVWSHGLKNYASAGH